MVASTRDHCQMARGSGKSLSGGEGASYAAERRKTKKETGRGCV